MRGFTDYLAAGFNTSTHALRNPQFIEVISSIDRAYALIRHAEHTLPGLARIFIVCHQALYSSASLICRGVPHDAAAPSRRALEAAHLALATRSDPASLKEWISFDERMARWQSREKGGKPPKLTIGFDGLSGDQLSRKISAVKGALADSKVHFTPEFLSEIDFQERPVEGILFSNYLVDDEHAQAQSFKMLVAAHFLILRALARAGLKELAVSSQFQASLQRIALASRALYVRYPFRERPEFESAFEDT